MNLASNWFKRSISAATLLLLMSMGSTAQTMVTINGAVTLGSWQTEVGWQIVNQGNGTTYHCRLQTGSPALSTLTTFSFQAPPGNYEVRAFDSYGDTWNNNFLTLTNSLTGAILVNRATLSVSGAQVNACPGPTAVNNANYVIATFRIDDPCAAPSVTSQLRGGSSCVGGSYTFSVGTNMTNGTYDWRKDGVILATTSSPVYTVSNITAQSAGIYDVVLRAACNPAQAVTIAPGAELRVVPAPSITQQPASIRAICEGAADTLRIRAVGDGRTFQWRRNGVNIIGATDSNYIIPNGIPSIEGSYDCVVTGTCAPPAVSTPCNVTVVTRPRTTLEPMSQAICPGTTATLSYSAVGNQIIYQWYRNGVEINGATNPTLSLANFTAANDGRYVCIARSTVPNPNNCVVTVQSREVTLTAYKAPVPVSSPQSSDACVGGTITLQSEFTGSDMQYQWFRNGMPVANANGNTLVIERATAAQSGWYRCRATSTCGLNATTDSAIVSVIGRPGITLQPVSQTLTTGQTLTLSMEATDARQIQWLKNGQPIAGATSATYTIPAVTKADAGSYVGTVRNTCGVVQSNIALIRVNDPEVPTPRMTVAKASVDAGEIPVGYDKTVDNQAMIVSAGTAPLQITSVAIDNPAFIVTTNPPAPATLAPGTSMSVTIRAVTTTTGALSGTLTISSNDANSPSVTVPIAALAVLRYEHPTTVAFGDVRTDASQELCATVTNTSAVAITIDAATITGTGATSYALASATTLPLSLAAGASAEVCIRFTPATTGELGATLNVVSSTGGNSSLTLSGNGVPPVSVTDASSLGISMAPNPTAEGIAIRFGTSMETMTIRIVAMDGSMVANVTHPAVNAGDVVRWNGRGFSGALVPSGVYTVVMTSGNTIVTSPLSVIR